MGFVESSLSDDPLLLKPLYEGGTLVDDDDGDEDANPLYQSTGRVKGWQTEPRGKGKGRASDFGMDLYGSSVKSKLTSTGSKKIVASFPFRPYTNMPAGPRIVPEWVPRTVRKKKVELDYDLENAGGHDQEGEAGNETFDYATGQYADGFGSDGESDFGGGGGYDGDDTFMNILTRRDAASGSRPFEHAEEREERQIYDSFDHDQSPYRSPSLFVNRAASRSPVTRPIPDHRMSDASKYPSPPPSPSLTRHSLLESTNNRGSSPPSSPLQVPSDHDDKAGTAIDDEYLAVQHDPSSPELRDSTPYVTEEIHASYSSQSPAARHEPEDESLDAATQDLGTSFEVDTTVEADVTVEGASGSWDESMESIKSPARPECAKVDEAERGEMQVQFHDEYHSRSWEESIESSTLLLRPEMTEKEEEGEQEMGYQLKGNKASRDCDVDEADREEEEAAAADQSLFQDNYEEESTQSSSIESSDASQFNRRQYSTGSPQLPNDEDVVAKPMLSTVFENVSRLVVSMGS